MSGLRFKIVQRGGISILEDFARNKYGERGCRAALETEKAMWGRIKVLEEALLRATDHATIQRQETEIKALRRALRRIRTVFAGVTGDSIGTALTKARGVIRDALARKGE